MRVRGPFRRLQEGQSPLLTPMLMELRKQCSELALIVVGPARPGSLVLEVHF
jgi:hypothetical protein